MNNSIGDTYLHSLALLLVTCSGDCRHTRQHCVDTVVGTRLLSWLIMYTSIKACNACRIGLIYQCLWLLSTVLCRFCFSHPHPVGQIYSLSRLCFWMNCKLGEPRPREMESGEDMKGACLLVIHLHGRNRCSKRGEKLSCQQRKGARAQLFLPYERKARMIACVACIASEIPFLLAFEGYGPVWLLVTSIKYSD
jgi:hypothetical protein